MRVMTILGLHCEVCSQHETSKSAGGLEQGRICPSQGKLAQAKGQGAWAVWSKEELDGDNKRRWVAYAAGRSLKIIMSEKFLIPCIEHHSTSADAEASA